MPTTFINLIADCHKYQVSGEIIEKDTSYFVMNGASARCTQFSLQNALSLTVHKTQD